MPCIILSTNSSNPLRRWRLGATHSCHVSAHVFFPGLDFRHSSKRAIHNASACTACHSIPYFSHPYNPPTESFSLTNISLLNISDQCRKARIKTGHDGGCDLTAICSRPSRMTLPTQAQPQPLKGAADRHHAKREPPQSMRELSKFHVTVAYSISHP